MKKQAQMNSGIKSISGKFGSIAPRIYLGMLSFSNSALYNRFNHFPNTFKLDIH